MRGQATTAAVAFVFALVLILLFHRKRKPGKKDYKLYEIKQRLMPVDPEAVSSVEFFESNSSYTENKSEIYLCLRDPNTGGYYDTNTLTYVALHELAHVKSHTLHHTEEFKVNFRKLLKKAEALGIYHSHWPLANVYCGVKMR
jgi:hypothetical protein